MKIKCKICGKVEKTYLHSPNHMLELCDKHWIEHRTKHIEDFIDWMIEKREMEYARLLYDFHKDKGLIQVKNK